MKLIIGNKNYSSWSMRASLAAKQSGLPFEELTVNIGGDDWQVARQSGEIMPSGKVPILWDGEVVVWDSLAILEYLADKVGRERFWPKDDAARGMARAVTAEMHSSFRALRSECPMNVRARIDGHRISDECKADIVRVLQIWAEARARFGQGGPFLFGTFGAADVFYAPVVSRFITYGFGVPGFAEAYMETVWEQEWMQAWIHAAEEEEWTIEQYEVPQRGLTAALAAIALCLPAPVLAWGGYGHRTTAEIAEANVSPQTRAAMNRLFAYEDRLGTPDCRMRDLADASTWPDCVRRDGWRWGYTAAWHYRTTPVCEAYNERANCSGGNCVTAQIERAQRLLADESLPGHIRLEALSFLVHFVGDVHMPLHSGDREDRGGNDRETDYGIVPDLNLHWIWDGPLAERAISTARPSLVRRYSAQERAEIATGGPHDWGRESWQIARDMVYRTAFDRDPCAGELPAETALSQEDIEAGIPVANGRVLQAGLRIARLLDEAFAPGPLPVPERAGR